jgi:hypothetical protein
MRPKDEEGGFVFEFSRNLKTKRPRETRPRSRIDDGFREEQSKITEWQNIYVGIIIMVLGPKLRIKMSLVCH